MTNVITFTKEQREFLKDAIEAWIDTCEAARQDLKKSTHKDDRKEAHRLKPMKRIGKECYKKVARIA